MYRVVLTAEQKEVLNRLCHDKSTKPTMRTRLEMLRLAHAGWSIPKIAQHFALTESRVRHWVKAFLSGGFAALESRSSPGRTRKLTQEILSHIKAVVGEDGRTWTAPQVKEWLEQEHGLLVNRTWLCETLNRNGLSYKRTTRTLRHKQSPEQVQSKRSDLETLQRGRSRG